MLVVVGRSTVRNNSNSVGFYSTMTTVQLWDVADRAQPRLEKTLQLEGSYLTGRMIAGRIYLVTQTWPSWLNADGSPWQWGSDSSKHIRSASPLFRELMADVAKTPDLRSKIPFRPVEASANKIGRLSGLGPVSSWITVISIDIDKTRTSYGSWSASTHAGRGNTVMVSRKHIYVAATTYNYERVLPSTLEDTLPEGDDEKPSLGVWSAIMRFETNSGSPIFAGIAEVEGSIINQFAMDEHQGHLRVATTRGEMWAQPSTSESVISVLNEYLEPVGLLQGIAPGERIYSVRFMGQRGYVVTYRQVDPFFVFDLTEPEAPTMLGYLKIPGFSDYLHPLAGNYMLGVGKDTEQVAGSELVITKGIKLSLFNVNDPENPTEEAVLVLGDRGSTTEVSYEHKAFLYHQGSGVISLPVDLHQAQECRVERTAGGACPSSIDYEPSTFQGAYVIYLDGGDTKSFRVHGRITHEHLSGTRNDASDTSRVMWGLWGGWGWRSSLRRVYRSIFMDGLLYTISDRHMLVSKHDGVCRRRLCSQDHLKCCR